MFLPVSFESLYEEEEEEGKGRKRGRRRRRRENKMRKILYERIFCLYFPRVVRK